jgi:hypothetical protein
MGGPAYIHCLHEERNQIFRLQNTLRIIDFVQRFGYYTNRSLA